MPIIKSAKKRARQSLVHYGRNQIFRKNLRSSAKSFENAVKAKSAEKVTKTLLTYQSNIDKAVKKNLIPKQRASKLLSRAMLQAATVVKPSNTKKKTAKKVVAKKPAKKTAPKKSKSTAKTVKKSPVRKKS